MRYLCIIYVLVLMSLESKAQDRILNTAQSVGAGNIKSLSVIDNSSSCIDVDNPSLAGRLHGGAVNVTYILPFGMQELGQISGRMVLGTKLVNMSACVGRSGNSDSHFTTLGGGFSKKWGKWGLGFEYYALIHTMIDNRKFSTSFSRFGMFVSPVDRWLMSVAINGIEKNSMKYDDRVIEFKPIVWAGLRWHANDKFAFFTEVEKEFDAETVGKVAVAIYPVRHISATIGFETKGQTLSMGAGFNLKGFGMHVGISYHDQLGVSSGASAGCLWGGKR